MSSRDQPEYRDETLKYHRRVFSWLVAVQAAVLLATAADPDVGLERAVEQIKAIEKSLQSWDDGWMHTAARTRIAEVQEKHPDYWPSTFTSDVLYELMLVGDPVPNLPGPILARFGGASYSLRGPNGVSLSFGDPETRPPYVYNSPFTLSEPGSMNDFQTLWNVLDRDTRITLAALPAGVTPARVHVLKGEDTGAYVTLVELLETEKPRLETNGVSGPARPLWLTLTAASSKVVADLSELVQVSPVARGAHNSDLITPTAPVIQTALAYSPLLGLGQKPHSFTIEVAVPSYEVPIALQKLLRDQLDVDVALGSFELSFSELDSQIKGIESLSIPELRALLVERRRSINRDVQILGLTFPVGSLSIWGAGFLLLLQYYFFIGLRALEPTIQKADSAFPWIALFEDQMARISFAALSFFVPFGVVCFVGYPVLEADWGGGLKLLMAAIIAASGCVAALGCSVYLKILRKL